MLSEFAVWMELGPTLPGSQLCQTWCMSMEGRSESRKKGERWCLTERQEDPCATFVFSKDSEGGCFWLRIQGRRQISTLQIWITHCSRRRWRGTFLLLSISFETYIISNCWNTFWSNFQSEFPAMPSQFLREHTMHESSAKEVKSEKPDKVKHEKSDKAGG